MRDCWNRDANPLKLHEKQNRSQFPHPLKPCNRRFSWEFNFADFEFFRFRWKNFREFQWISDFTPENNFSWISCSVFESNLNASHLGVFVTLFAANFIEVQQCKKGVNCFGIYYRRSMKIPRKLRSTRLFQFFFFFHILHTESVDHTLVNDKFVSDDKDISESFNDFFVNIGPTLTAGSTKRSSNNVNTYLNNIQNNFYLQKRFTKLVVMGSC